MKKTASLPFTEKASSVSPATGNHALPEGKFPLVPVPPQKVNLADISTKGAKRSALSPHLITDVYAHNLREELDKISQFIDLYPYVAMVCTLLLFQPVT